MVSGYPSRGNFKLISPHPSAKIQPAVYIRRANLSRGTRQLFWASCPASTSGVLASGTTFPHVNALARLTGTTLGSAEFRENLATWQIPLWSNDQTKLKKDICTFNYSVRSVNNHAEPTLTRPTGTTFSHINALYSSLGRRVASGNRDHITGALVCS